MKKSRFIPLTVFSGVVVLLLLGLRLDPRALPSSLVNKTIPSFNLPSLHTKGTVSDHDFRGQVWVMNVWASWCVACQREHDLLLQWQWPEGVKLVGLNYKDYPNSARHWLHDMGGDPYDAIAVDSDGKTGIDLGVYGVPETFVMDRDGRILLRHTGALDATAIIQNLAPVIREALQR